MYCLFYNGYFKDHRNDHYSTIYHATSQWVFRSDTQQCEEIRAFEFHNYKCQ